MSKQSLVVSFLFVLLLCSPVASASEHDQKDWLVYLDSENHIRPFLQLYPSIVLDTTNHVVSLSAPSSVIDEIEKLPFVSHVEPNYTKSVTAQDNIYNDPLFSQQWALSKINSTQTLQRYKNKQVNLVKGQQVINEHSGQKATYTGQSLNASHFTLTGNKMSLSRLSVTLKNVHSSWSLHVYDEQNKLIGQNTGSHATLDVLLPKNKTYSSLTIKLTGIEKWPSIPTIKHVVGVNHVRVAVIDSGVAQHEDFCENVLVSLSKDYKESLPYANDQFGHGTHVTGILAACGHNARGITGIIGNAPVDIIPLKVLDGFGNGTDFDISQAVEDAIEMDVDVMNMSLAGKGETTMLREAIMGAIKKNILVVASAGNNRLPTDEIYPASYPGVLTVTGTEPNNETISIANYGWAVDISAPGSSILSTHLNQQYKTMRGTSMATPFVSGTAALVKATYPHLDFVTMRQHLLRTTVDIKENGYDQWTGKGLLQVDQALLQKPASYAAEWLNLKPNQPLRSGGSYLLGTSASLLQKDALLFVNESLIGRKKIEEAFQLFTLTHTSSTRKKIDVHALFVTQQDDILYETYVPAQNSQAKAASTLKDVHPSFWAYEEIKKANEAELINGYEDGSFKPNNSITRRHSVMMLNRLFQWPLPSSLSLPFDDTPVSIPGFISLLSTYHQGIVKGYENKFKPEENLTRAQMAVILARALKIDLTQVTKVHSFHDVASSHHAYAAIQHLTKLGIITKQDAFRPNEQITRAQFCAMLIRVKQQIDS
ncbi:S8 family peptidase [Metabacillus iocasae]|uniref:Subtilisin family serine protease n=1 Tax=Priestia iocasae TaxID=2291674 RepID=A0ABS2QXS3_9BACI|nr:S8 family serine peptidase [Metabacillus iocasae]MBM7703983.1 subtilisin family serine protease [Metabacillus iocasae]